MPGDLRHSKHLIMLAAVVVGAIAGFLLLRAAVVPEGFGKYGHYRAGSLEDNRRKPVSFAGQVACAPCHEDVVAARGKGKHQIVSCEACHGALAFHAEDPAQKPKRPDSATLCRQCHEADTAKPRGFPQVVIKDHYGEACGSCHQPHAPKL
jgi:hypothetical protein